ncbi:Phosphoribosyl-AMP cyclohydrolase [Candidatus Hodgkinia cicadicola]|nr:Phosphoribosyl-AMP cyclohydrolase [Candidatus Hodgkinia cicadicola]
MSIGDGSSCCCFIGDALLFVCVSKLCLRLSFVAGIGARVTVMSALFARREKMCGAQREVGGNVCKLASGLVSRVDAFDAFVIGGDSKFVLRARCSVSAAYVLRNVLSASVYD